MTYPGKLIAFEGIDGSGKTTQLQLLAHHLQTTQGRFAVRTLREPGGTPLGEQLRTQLKNPDNAACAQAQLFIVLASRSQLVHHVIRPALQHGDMVLIDRFTASTIAYQAYGGKLDVEQTASACNFATGGLEPDLTLWFDLDVAQARYRLRSRSETADLFDQKGPEFFQQVRAGYAEQYRHARSGRWNRIDASAAPQAISGYLATLIRQHSPC